MRIRRLMYDSFYYNNGGFSGVTAVESLESTLWFHYIKDNSGHYKLSGNTAATASGVIFEDSVTTSITVTPAANYLYSGGTVQLVVLNQDNIDVTSESVFVSSNSGISRVNATGLVTAFFTGTTTTTATHNDGPSGSTSATIYWPGPVAITPAVATGTTGSTVQFTLTSTPTTKVITTLATWSIAASGVTTTGVTINSGTGLVTIAAGLPPQRWNVTAIYGALTDSPITTVKLLVINGG